MKQNEITVVTGYFCVDMFDNLFSVRIGICHQLTTKSMQHKYLSWSFYTLHKCVCMCLRVCVYVNCWRFVDARTLFLWVVYFLFNKSWHITLCQCRCRMGGFMYMCMFFDRNDSGRKAPGLRILNANHSCVLLIDFNSDERAKCYHFVGLSQKIL